MSRRIAPNDWYPRGVESLEKAAQQALRSPSSEAIVAGPGAGKTELLAQRAAFLLETGACPAPHKILAISFKTDAAENLAARVKARCPPDLTHRFVSVTFDAFTKGLLDRFWTSVPRDWRPTKPYAITFPKRAAIAAWLAEVQTRAPASWERSIAVIRPERFEPDFLGKQRLPLRPQPPGSGVEFALADWWLKCLPDGEQSELTFTAINRLVELLLRTSPQIREALRQTYKYVFIDEFQDTTHAQYDLLTTAFHESGAVLTAVGDYKQRIMLWAGARPNAFDAFEEEFQAKRRALLFNFRSSPELVRVQHVVASAMDKFTIPTTSQAKAELAAGVVQVWVSPSRDAEANYLARWIAKDMKLRGHRPRDYAILVRQTADDFEHELQPYFLAQGLSLRNESKDLGKVSLQDLMADELVVVVMALLRMATGEKSPALWAKATTTVEHLLGAAPDDDQECLSAQAELESLLRDLRVQLGASAPSAGIAHRLVNMVYGTFGMDRIVRSYARYHSNDLAQIVQDALKHHLSNCTVGAANWKVCLDQCEGVDHVPLLTVHKSKGLEYDTIAFVGLDDKSWWSHNPGNPEGLATFFVALSRAKQRALFLFCEARGSRAKVADLYQLLRDAGVPELRLSTALP